MAKRPWFLAMFGSAKHKQIKQPASVALAQEQKAVIRAQSRCVEMFWLGNAQILGMLTGSWP
jgi:hypothetical protein